jgi:hypothetical protein
MTAAMGRLAGHDLAVEIPGAGRRDEIGGMADAGSKASAIWRMPARRCSSAEARASLVSSSSARARIIAA